MKTNRWLPLFLIVTAVLSVLFLLPIFLVVKGGFWDDGGEDALAGEVVLVRDPGERDGDEEAERRGAEGDQDAVAEALGVDGVAEDRGEVAQGETAVVPEPALHDEEDRQEEEDGENRGDGEEQREPAIGLHGAGFYQSPAAGANGR